MLKLALFFFIVSIIAGVFGFTGMSVGAAGIAKVLFFICPKPDSPLSNNPHRLRSRFRLLRSYSRNFDERSRRENPARGTEPLHRERRKPVRDTDVAARCQPPASARSIAEFSRRPPGTARYT